jgi:hypothetical protein
VTVGMLGISLWALPGLARTTISFTKPICRELLSQVWHPIPGAQDELYVSSSLGLGGFASGDITQATVISMAALSLQQRFDPRRVYRDGGHQFKQRVCQRVAFDPFGSYGLTDRRLIRATSIR